MAEAADLAQVRRQPLLQAGQQRRVGHLRPVAGAALRQVQAAQQQHARLPLAQLRRPGQQLQALAAHQLDQRAAARCLVQRGQRLATQHQLADPALAFGAQHAFALVPVQHLLDADLFGEHRVEQRRIQIGGQVDALLALALAAAEVGDHQPFVLHQRVRLAELRGAAVGQPVVAALGAALAGDAVRVGEGQQRAEPARMLGVGHRRAGRSAQLLTVLARQLTDALHRAARPAACLAGEQRQPAVQVGAGAAQDVALTEQRRQLAGQRGQPQRLALEQQVGDARMRRQFGHRLAVGR